MKSASWAIACCRKSTPPWPITSSPASSTSRTCSASSPSASSYQREIHDADKSTSKPFAAIPAGRLRGDEVFDSLEAAIEIPNVTPPQKAADRGEFRFPPPPKSTRDLVNEAFGFDPSAEQANVARTMQQAMLLMNNKQVQAQVNADPASGTVLAEAAHGRKRRRSRDHQALRQSPGPQADDAGGFARPDHLKSARQPQRRLRRLALGAD